MAKTHKTVGATVEETAKALGMSIEEVKRLEASALKKLRHPLIGGRHLRALLPSETMEEDYEY